MASIIIDKHKMKNKPCNFTCIKSNPFSNKTTLSRYYSTMNNNNNNSKLLELNPYFVSGFIDAEASFTTVVYYTNRLCTNSVFKITLHKKDIQLLKALEGFFGVGKITGIDTVTYRVESKKSLMDVLIPHLDKYPLQTKKRADYELFKQIVFLMDQKQHLNNEGLQRIINIKAAMNRGVSEELLAEFPNTSPVSRPLVNILDINPYWLAGFTAGDGCFFIYAEKDSKYRTGIRVKLRFNICQHVKDKLLMERIASYFNCGLVNVTNTGEVNFDVHKFSDIYDVIVPFFDKYAIYGMKSLDFKD